MSHADILFLPGDMLDERYEMGLPLSVGSVTHVYAARHVHTEVDMAIKVVVLAGTDDAIEEQIERLRREATTVGQLGHPNVVTVHDFGFVNGERTRPYLAMDRLKGRTLDAELTQQGPVEIDRVMGLLMPCLDALAKAHRLGVVHKSIEPQNLFLNEPGEPGERLVLLDFSGASRRGDPRLTKAGETIGAPQYMAPEYIESADDVSPALDVYQMGLVIAEMLTGQPMVPLDSVDRCIKRHLDGNLKLDEAVRDGVLGPVLLKATARQPSERYQHAGELAEALVASGAFSSPELAAVPSARPNPETLAFGLPTGNESASGATVPLFSGEPAAAASDGEAAAPLDASSEPAAAPAPAPVPVASDPKSKGMVLGIALGAAGLLLFGIVGLVLIFSGGDSNTEDVVAVGEEQAAEELPSAETWRNLIDSYDATAESMANRSLLAKKREVAVRQLKIYQSWDIALTHAASEECVEALRVLVKIPEDHELRTRPEYQSTKARCRKDGVAGLLRLAQTAMVKKAWDKAETYLAEAETLDPDNAELKEAQSQLAATRPKGKGKGKAKASTRTKKRGGGKARTAPRRGGPGSGTPRGGSRGGKKGGGAFGFRR